MGISARQVFIFSKHERLGEWGGGRGGEGRRGEGRGREGKGREGRGGV